MHMSPKKIEQQNEMAASIVILCDKGVGVKGVVTIIGQMGDQYQSMSWNVDDQKRQEIGRINVYAQAYKGGGRYERQD